QVGNGISAQQYENEGQQYFFELVYKFVHFGVKTMFFLILPECYTTEKHGYESISVQGFGKAIGKQAPPKSYKFHLYFRADEFFKFCKEYPSHSLSRSVTHRYTGQNAVQKVSPQPVCKPPPIKGTLHCHEYGQPRERKSHTVIEAGF